MVFVYVDESGTGLGKGQFPYFVLASVAIHADDWAEVDGSVYAFKQRLLPWAKPEDYEIKGRDMRRGENLYKSLAWSARTEAIQSLAELLTRLPCDLFAVQLDKRLLPESVMSNDLMYRLAMTRLLDELEVFLEARNETALLMFDMRSDQHSSVQDRRLVDAYRERLNTRRQGTRFVELPWFGFSAFYTGLQLADFTAYMVDLLCHENRSSRDRALEAAGTAIKSKCHWVTIP